MLSRPSGDEVLREDALLRAWEIEYDEFAEPVTRLVAQHIAPLSLKWDQAIYQDDYGNYLLDRWYQERDYFIDNVLRKNSFIATSLASPERKLWANEIITDAIRNFKINQRASNASLSINVDSLDPIQFEHYCADILRNSGWDVRVTQAAGDQGIDLIANHGNVKAVFQCKKYSQPVGNSAVQEIIAGKQFEQASIAAVVSNHSYTHSAKQLANATDVHLLHFTELEQFAEIVGIAKPSDLAIVQRGNFSTARTISSSSNPHHRLALREHAQPQEEALERALRPRFLDEYIGQEIIRWQLEIYIEAARKRKEPLDHVLLFGPPGLGKATLAHIIACEMGVNLCHTSGSELESIGDLAALLTNLEPHDVLFINEIHHLSPVVVKMLCQALADYQIDIMIGEGPAARSVKLDLPPFTLVGATMNAGMLSNPLRNGFGIVEQLGVYSISELQRIVTRTAGLLELPISPDGALEIAKHSRGTPRITNRLLRGVRDYAEKRGQDATLAVTDAALITLNLPPLATANSGIWIRAGFGIVAQLENLSVSELQRIVTRSAEILELPISQEGALEIATRSRGTPRIANQLLRRVRDYAEVRADGEVTLIIADAVLTMLDIDAQGLDGMNRNLLFTLIVKFTGRPVDVDSLAKAMGEECDTIENVIEPYLIQQGYLLRTTDGRVATANAFKHFGFEMYSYTPQA